MQLSTNGSEELVRPAPATMPVTVDNFVRAETDMHFMLFARRGGFGKFHHVRELPLENTGMRPSRDTLYSEAVFDLDAGPVSIGLPPAGRRFMSMMVMDEDHYVLEVVYGSGKHSYTRGQVGTRYLFAAVRILVDAQDPDDIRLVRFLQDEIRVCQAQAGRLEMPPWDPSSQGKVRDALLTLRGSLSDLSQAFGNRLRTDPIQHLIGTASAWGGHPEKDAVHLSVTPRKNDGRTIYRLTVRDVPVDAFWSISIYDAEGRFRKNDLGAYTLNNISAKAGKDGSITVQFGGYGAKPINCLPIFPGWNYMVRLYRPRSEILSGRWTFPEAQAMP